LKTILAFDKSTHPVSPSAGAYHYIAAGVFTHPRPEAVIDDLEKLANSIAAFERIAEPRLLSLRIAASGQKRNFL